MELKLPPAVVFLIFAMLMFLLAYVFPFGHFDFFGRLWLSIFLIGAGLILAIIALIQFYIAKTTIDPSNPNKSSVLVSVGVYTFTRNPMYLAMLLVLLALGVYLGNAFNVLVAAGFVGYMNHFQIIPEEKVLLNKFGRAYKDYCILTRRWF